MVMLLWYPVRRIEDELSVRKFGDLTDVIQLTQYQMAHPFREQRGQRHCRQQITVTIIVIMTFPPEATSKPECAQSNPELHVQLGKCDIRNVLLFCELLRCLPLMAEVILSPGAFIVIDSAFVPYALSPNYQRRFDIQSNFLCWKMYSSRQYNNATFHCLFQRISFNTQSLAQS